jgi:hypothetical protein
MTESDLSPREEESDLPRDGNLIQHDGNLIQHDGDLIQKRDEIEDASIYRFDETCFFSSSSIEGRSMQSIVEREGTLPSEEERPMPATTLINIEGSDCKCPIKLGESLPHETPNEGQASERRIPLLTHRVL